MTVTSISIASYALFRNGVTQENSGSAEACSELMEGFVVAAGLEGDTLSGDIPMNQLLLALQTGRTNTFSNHIPISFLRLSFIKFTTNFLNKLSWNSLSPGRLDLSSG